MFNSGVMVLTRTTHLPLLRGWRSERLTCRILCDQLYWNALLWRERAPLHDLGAPFNLLGSELKRALLTSGRPADALADAAAPLRRRAALHGACILHMTRKVPKAPVASWVAYHALGPPADALQCANVTHAAWPRASGWRLRLRQQLPSPGKRGASSRLEAELCRGQPAGCALQPWASPLAWQTRASAVGE